LDELILVPLPGEQDRVQILQAQGARIALQVDIHELAKCTEGCTAADLAVLIREAGIHGIMEDPNCAEISSQHLWKAFAEKGVAVPPSFVTNDSMDHLEMQLSQVSLESSNSLKQSDYLERQKERFARVMQPYSNFLRK
jgi:SpoVK/Ycf46/Vps4 family AAA+-type ATPase